MQKTDSKSSHRFDLQLLPKNCLQRVTIEGKRHYSTPDGTFPSVTTVLSTKLDHSGLDEWRNKVGNAEADKISTQAANRGTAIHDICEKYILGLDYRANQMPINMMTFSSIKPILDNNVGKVYGIEYPLWSKKLYTAGTTDMICEFNGINSIVDFKTSKRPKEAKYIESYFLQATCYAMMTEARTKMNIETINIIIAVDHDEPQLFSRNSYEYRDRVLKLFQPTDKPHK